MEDPPPLGPVSPRRRCAWMRRLVRRCERGAPALDCGFLRDLTGRVCGPPPSPPPPLAALPFYCVEVPWYMVEALDPV